MSRHFDDLTRRATGMRTRRQMFTLLGRAAIGAAVGAQALQFLNAPTVLAENCLVEYPPANLDDCPNKRHHPGNTPTSNGCGSAKPGSFKPGDVWGRANFAASGCNVHDICYETCGASKTACDTAFGEGLSDGCIAAYAGTGAFLRETGCLVVADVYHTFVTLLGADSFDAAQKKDCECCHPVVKIRCGCTGICYDSGSACTTACKASLGCFGPDICAPALAGQCA